MRVRNCAQVAVIAMFLVPASAKDLSKIEHNHGINHDIQNEDIHITGDIVDGWGSITTKKSVTIDGVIKDHSAIRITADGSVTIRGIDEKSSVVIHAGGPVKIVYISAANAVPPSGPSGAWIQGHSIEVSDKVNYGSNVHLYAPDHILINVVNDDDTQINYCTSPGNFLVRHKESKALVQSIGGAANYETCKPTMVP